MLVVDKIETCSVGSWFLNALSAQSGQEISPISLQKGAVRSQPSYAMALVGSGECNLHRPIQIGRSGREVPYR